MNKQLTKKTIGIAASAALMAATLSATAVAGPGKANKGPKPSISVSNVCNVTYDAMTGAPLLEVVTRITDTGDLTAQISEDGIVFTPILGIGNNKGGGKKPDEGKWSVADMSRSGDEIPSGNIEGTVKFTSLFSMCDDPRTKDANTVNALVTVKVDGGHKEDGWTSYCDDVDTDGDGYPDEFSNTDIGHLGLCAE